MIARLLSTACCLLACAAASALDWSLAESQVVVVSDAAAARPIPVTIVLDEPAPAGLVLKNPWGSAAQATLDRQGVSVFMASPIPGMPPPTPGQIAIPAGARVFTCTVPGVRIAADASAASDWTTELDLQIPGQPDRRLTIQVRNAARGPGVQIASVPAAPMGANAVLVTTIDDPAGGGTTLAWSQLDGPAVDLSAAQGPAPVVALPAVGAYSFRCTATDAQGRSAHADVTVTRTRPRIVVGGTLPLLATVVDQFGAVLPAADLTWTVSGGGSVVEGVFTPGDQPGLRQITVTAPSVPQGDQLEVQVAGHPALSWALPEPLPAGMPLDASRLQAVASVPGTFAYTPPAGTAFAEPGTVTLSAVFTPADADAWEPATVTTPLQVIAGVGFAIGGTDGMSSYTSPICLEGTTGDGMDAQRATITLRSSVTVHGQPGFALGAVTATATSHTTWLANVPLHPGAETVIRGQIEQDGTTVASLRRVRWLAYDLTGRSPTTILRVRQGDALLVTARSAGAGLIEITAGPDRRFQIADGAPVAIGCTTLGDMQIRATLAGAELGTITVRTMGVDIATGETIACETGHERPWRFAVRGGWTDDIVAASPNEAELQVRPGGAVGAGIESAADVTAVGEVLVKPMDFVEDLPNRPLLLLRLRGGAGVPGEQILGPVVAAVPVEAFRIGIDPDTAAFNDAPPVWRLLTLPAISAAVSPAAGSTLPGPYRLLRETATGRQWGCYDVGLRQDPIPRPDLRQIMRHADPGSQPVRVTTSEAEPLGPFVTITFNAANTGDYIHAFSSRSGLFQDLDGDGIPSYQAGILNLAVDGPDADQAQRVQSQLSLAGAGIPADVELAEIIEGAGVYAQHVELMDLAEYDLAHAALTRTTRFGETLSFEASHALAQYGVYGTGQLVASPGSDDVVVDLLASQPSVFTALVAGHTAELRLNGDLEWGGETSIVVDDEPHELPGLGECLPRGGILAADSNGRYHPLPLTVRVMDAFGQRSLDLRQGIETPMRTREVRTIETIVNPDGTRTLREVITYVQYQMYDGGPREVAAPVTLVAGWNHVEVLGLWEQGTELALNPIRRLAGSVFAVGTTGRITIDGHPSSTARVNYQSAIGEMVPSDSLLSPIAPRDVTVDVKLKRIRGFGEVKLGDETVLSPVQDTSETRQKTVTHREYLPPDHWLTYPAETLVGSAPLVFTGQTMFILQLISDRAAETELEITIGNAPPQRVVLHTDPTTVSRPAGTGDGIAPPVSVLPPYLQATSDGRTLSLHAPLRVDGGPESGLDLTAVWSSDQLYDEGHGPGWRSNWDLRLHHVGFSQWHLLEEDGRSLVMGPMPSPSSLPRDGVHEIRNLQFGPPTGPRYLAELRVRWWGGEPVVTAAATADGDWRVGEAMRVARQDNRVLYFDADGFLTRIAHIDGRSWRVTREAETRRVTSVAFHRGETQVASLDIAAAWPFSTDHARMAQLPAEAVGGNLDFAYTSTGYLERLTLRAGTGATAARWSLRDDQGNPLSTLVVEPSWGQFVYGPQWLTAVRYGAGGPQAVFERETQGDPLAAAVTFVDLDGGRHLYRGHQQNTRSGVGPDGVAWSVAVLANGGTETTVGGRTTRVEADAFGRPTVRTAWAGTPIAAVTTYAWTDHGVFGGLGLRAQADIAVEGLENLGSDRIETTWSYGTSGAERGRLLAVTDACGVTRSIERNAATGLPVATTDGRQQRTSLDVDPDTGLLRGTTSPLGRSASMTLVDGLPTASSDRLQVATGYAWSPERRLAEITGPDGSASTLRYDPLGRLVEQRDALGRTTRLVYDLRGRLVSRVIEAGQVDAAQGVVAATHPAPPAETWTWTTVPDGWQVTHARGTQTVTRQVYDRAGRLVADTALRSLVDGQNGATACTTTYAYDAATGDLRFISHPDGGREELAYDAAGRLTRRAWVVPQDGGERRWQFNRQGWLLSERDPVGGTTSFLYDACGRVTTTTNPAGGWTRQGRDAEGMVNVEVLSQGGPTGMQLDADGDLAVTVDRDGRVTTHDLARVADEIVSSQSWDPAPGASVGLRAETRHDPVQRRTRALQVAGAETIGASETQQRADGSAQERSGAIGTRSATVVDTFGRPVQTIVDAILDGGGASGQREALVSTIDYDALGLPIGGTSHLGLTTRQIRDAATGEVNEVQDSRSGALAPIERILARDSMGRVTRWGRFTAANAASPELISRRTYDQRGYLATESGPDGIETAYHRDAAGRVERIERAGRVIARMAYDSLGNVVRQEDGAGRVVVSAYDALGRLISRTSAGETTSYRYDAITLRLRGVTHPDGSETTYGYDAAGRLETVRHPDGSAVKRRYDAADRVEALLIGRVGAERLHQAYGYDPVSGALRTITQADGRVTTLHRDATGAVYQRVIRHPSGAETVVSTAVMRAAAAGIPAPAGAVLVEQDQVVGEAIARRWYDALGRMVRQDSGDSQVPIAWDHAARRTQAAHLGYGYEPQTGRLQQVSAAGGGSATLGYDAEGRLERLLLPHGIERILGYDAADRIASVSYTGAGAEDRQWQVDRDGMGRVTALRSAQETRSFAYAGGRLEREELRRTGASPGTLVRSYAYDETGGLTRTVEEIAGGSRIADFATAAVPSELTLGAWEIADGAAAVGAATTGDDQAVLAGVGSRLALAAHPAVDAAVTVALREAETAIATVRWEIRPTTASGVAALNMPVADGRLVVTTGSSTVASTWEHLADRRAQVVVTCGADGRIQAVAAAAAATGETVELTAALASTADQDRGSWTWSIGATGQAAIDDLSWTTPTQRTVTRYTYAGPSVHQLATVERSAWSGGASASRQRTTWAYDDAGRMERQTTALDGVPVQEAVWTWDALDRVATMQVGSSLRTDRYAGSGTVRISTTVADGATTAVQSFRWLDDDIIGATVDGGETQYGRIGSQVHWQAGGMLPPQVHQIDPLGDTVARVTPMPRPEQAGTDITAVFRADYDAWGANPAANGRVTDSASTWMGGFGYKGYWSDNTTIGYRTGHRTYDPAHARFRSSDPAMAGENWYAYCGGDPVNRWDPSGLDYIKYEGNNVYWVPSPFKQEDFRGGGRVAPPAAYLEPQRTGTSYLIGQAHGDYVLLEDAYGGNAISKERLEYIASNLSGNFSSVHTLIEQGKFPLAQIPGYIGNVINYGRGRDFDGTHATAGELLAAGANNPVTRVAGAGLIILTLPVSGPISVGTAIVVGSGTAIAASEAASVGYELATGREHPGVIAGGLNLAGVDPNTSRYVVMAIEGVQIAIDIAMLRPKRLKIGSIDQTRADQLARDSATSRLRPGEGNVGAGMEGRYGPLERIPPGTAKPPDFRFTAGLNQGRTVDVVMADMPGSRFQSEWGNIKKIITGHLGKADVVPIDLRHISQSERQMVEGFVGSLSPHDQAKILFVE